MDDVRPPDPADLFSEGSEVIKAPYNRLSNDTHNRYNYGNANNSSMKHWSRIGREAPDLHYLAVIVMVAGGSEGRAAGGGVGTYVGHADHAPNPDEAARRGALQAYGGFVHRQ